MQHLKRGTQLVHECHPKRLCVSKAVPYASFQQAVITEFVSGGIEAAAPEFEFVEIHRVIDASSRFTRFGVLKKGKKAFQSGLLRDFCDCANSDLFSMTLYFRNRPSPNGSSSVSHLPIIPMPRLALSDGRGGRATSWYGLGIQSIDPYV
ncbi:hypothetical protein [Pandoraea sp. NPDC087047]|uniref:hypothetical protein n=1 Tax=Pandoraea sp. NPDC087047 TaxID=3364390 RepID=UPI003827DEC7